MGLTGLGYGPSGEVLVTCATAASLTRSRYRAAVRLYPPTCLPRWTGSESIDSSAIVAELVGSGPGRCRLTSFPCCGSDEVYRPGTAASNVRVSVGGSTLMNLVGELVIALADPRAGGIADDAPLSSASQRLNTIDPVAGRHHPDQVAADRPCVGKLPRVVRGAAQQCGKLATRDTAKPSSIER